MRFLSLFFYLKSFRLYKELFMRICSKYNKYDNYKNNNFG
jgi:hypothetical protein